MGAFNSLFAELRDQADIQGVYITEAHAQVSVNLAARLSGGEGETSAAYEQRCDVKVNACVDGGLP